MKSFKKNIKQFLPLLLFVLIHSIFSYNPFYNYTSSIKVSDIAIGDTYVWAATNGGLMRINPSTDNVQLRSGTDNFPDLKLNTLCFDNEGNLWVGTKNGYLYRISPRDRHSIYTSYYSSDWDINDIYSYGKYLIIGSSKGCSVFDINAKKVLQNAVSFGVFNSSVVNKITVYKDTLYLGCKEGVAKLDVSGGKLLTSNFLDKNIWITEFTGEAVISLTVYKDTLHYTNVVSAVLYNRICYAYNIENTNGTEDNYVYRDTIQWHEFSSKVTSMVEGKNRLCWFGTEENNVRMWDGSRFKSYKAGGLTFRNIHKVYIAKNGTVWCTPYVTFNKVDGVYVYPWWQGVAAYNGDNWTIYRKDHPWHFGTLGDGTDFLGVAEGPYGNMWFGCNGSCIKKYNPTKNRWDGYFIGQGGSSTFQFKPGNSGMRWGKCDAIAQDSSGFLWFAAYMSDSGSVVCYNPAIEIPSDTSDTISYRYFFPKGSPYHYEIPRQLNVDVTGNIFLGGGHSEEGRLIVFRYDEGQNPLTHGINNPILDVKLTKIWHLVSTEDTVTWIVTGEGLYHFQYTSLNGPSLLKVRNIPSEKSLRCMEVESNYRYLFDPFNQDDYYEKIESVLWLGTDMEGIARVNVHQMVKRDGVIDSIGIDSISYFTESNGLINNMINHMDLDKKNGFLWIATNDGLSRYNIGHSFKKIESNAKVSAYPNPFVLSRHTGIVFENLASGSSISIYTVDGRLVAIVDRESNVIKTGNEWKLEWIPDRDIIPGVYFYIAKREQEYELYKRRGVVGKLLILP